MSAFVLLTPGFPIDEEDTTCLPAFQQFALSFKKLYPQDKLIIIAFQYPFIKKEYLWNGIRVISLGGKNRPLVWRLSIWIRSYATLRKIKKENQLAGILSLWLSECAMLGNYFSKLNRVKHFMWLIGQDAKKSNQYVRRIRPLGKDIIAMSDFLQEEFYKNHHVKPFMVAENGIIPSSFPSFNFSERTIDIIGVGSLTALKNYSLFIEIIAELKKAFPSIKAILVGSGEEEASLKALANKLGLQQTIDFAGLLPHSAVFDLMNQSKIFLHTSHYEGNSTVLMEALYSGCFTFSTCALSNSLTPHLSILKTKEEFVNAITLHLEKQILAERIVFNTMDASTKKIKELYLN